MTSLKIITTEDGSSSIYSNDLKEGFHSKFGAVAESLHVFIRSGFDLINVPGEINVLEIGFGTGLNALLTLFRCSEKKIRSNYHALEPYPLSQVFYNQLNYPQYIKQENAKVLFNSIHLAEWDNLITMNDYFRIKKMKCRLEQKDLEDCGYHLIYFDAFSPEVQPELWTAEIFRKLNRSMKPEGIFVTYSAKGNVRRNLADAGFKVERIPGPKGKREMIRAIKIT
jgi:tRNA U34 5-methylaminomethyl-2-thiouridine-forming methyltransferase MnmC